MHITDVIKALNVRFTTSKPENLSQNPLRGRVANTRLVCYSNASVTAKHFSDEFVINLKSESSLSDCSRNFNQLGRAAGTKLNKLFLFSFKCDFYLTFKLMSKWINYKNTKVRKSFKFQRNFDERPKLFLMMKWLARDESTSNECDEVSPMTSELGAHLSYGFALQRNSISSAVSSAGVQSDRASSSDEQLLLNSFRMSSNVV